LEMRLSEGLVKTLDERTFWSRVSIGSPDECWPWSMYRSKDGYGQIHASLVHGRVIDKTHRVAWSLTNGAIPDGMSILHHCDNPPCCNPAHLYVGTHAQNNADRIERGRSSKGSHRPNAKLTEPDVVAILALASEGVRDPELAARYGVACSVIANIRLGKDWKHLPRSGTIRRNLTPECVRSIMSELRSGKKPKDVAKMFTVSAKVVRNIRSGRRWASVTQAA
jgi:hypothetical protein